MEQEEDPMSHLTLTPLGWFSRFDFSKTVEISGLLHQLDSNLEERAFRRYTSLQHWTDLYLISGTAPLLVQSSQFRRLTKLHYSFNLRNDGILKKVSHHVFGFEVSKSSKSRFYVKYGEPEITLHCFENESPELVAKVVARLYVRILIPLLCKKRRSKRYRKYNLNKQIRNKT